MVALRSVLSLDVLANPQRENVRTKHYAHAVILLWFLSSIKFLIYLTVLPQKTNFGIWGK